MKRSKLTAGLVISAIVAIALACVWDGRAKAIGVSANLNVIVGVDIRCTIVTSPLDFGNYLAGGINATQPLDGTGSITVNCTSPGGAQRVTIGQGTSPAPGSTNNNPVRRLSQGSSHLNYNLYSDAGHTLVWNNNNGIRTTRNYPQTMTVYGRIPAGQTGPAGIYTDAVLATITF
jgi:spore coat protein U-like protein